MLECEIPHTYKFHHTAAAKGYVTRKGIDRLAEEYHGKYGDGYIVRRPRWDTTRYHWITYYIQEVDRETA